MKTKMHHEIGWLIFHVICYYIAIGAPVIYRRLLFARYVFTWKMLCFCRWSQPDDDDQRQIPYAELVSDNEITIEDLQGYWGLDSVYNHKDCPVS
eukprot:UN16993